MTPHERRRRLVRSALRALDTMARRACGVGYWGDSFKEDGEQLVAWLDGAETPTTEELHAVLRRVRDVLRPGEIALRGMYPKAPIYASEVRDTLRAIESELRAPTPPKEAA